MNKECGVSIPSYIKSAGLNLVNFENCEGVEVSPTTVRCFLCKEGYALTFDNKCIRIGINKCYISKVIEGENGYEEQCLVCEGGFPKSGKCDEQGEKLKEFLEAAKCSHGALDARSAIGNERACALCIDKDYAVDISMDGEIPSKNFGKCVKKEIDMPGCGRIRNGRCAWCNHYKGYFMTKPGYCEKSSRTFELVSILLVIIIHSFLWR